MGMQCSPRLFGFHCCDVLRDSWEHLLSSGAYIMRADTPLTLAWLNRNDQLLTDAFEVLKLHGACKARCCMEEKECPGYPIRWTMLHNEILHPLMAKYAEHVREGLPFWSYGLYT